MWLSLLLASVVVCGGPQHYPDTDELRPCPLERQINMCDCANAMSWRVFGCELGTFFAVRRCEVRAVCRPWLAEGEDRCESREKTCAWVGTVQCLMIGESESGVRMVWTFDRDRPMGPQRPLWRLHRYWLYVLRTSDRGILGGIGSTELLDRLDDQGAELGGRAEVGVVLGDREEGLEDIVIDRPYEYTCVGTEGEIARVPWGRIPCGRER